MKKLAIGILTHNRNELLHDTLNSFYKYNSDLDSTALLIDNGSDKEYQNSNKYYSDIYDLKYIYNDLNKSMDINEKIEIGHMRLINELLKIDSDLYCILEDDWKCLGRIPVDEVSGFLNEHMEIGQIRLRDYKYDDTFYGGSSLHFVTKNKISFVKEEKIRSVSFNIAEMHWVNCCNIMKKDALQHMNTEFKSELDKMQLFHQLYPQNAQLIPGIFYHIGPQRIRNDFREKGLFLNEDIS